MRRQFASPFGLVARWHTDWPRPPWPITHQWITFFSNILLKQARDSELILRLSPSLSEDSRKLGVPVTITTILHPSRTWSIAHIPSLSTCARVTGGSFPEWTELLCSFRRHCLRLIYMQNNICTRMASLKRWRKIRALKLPSVSL